jgi:hypothetical protein
MLESGPGLQEPKLFGFRRPRPPLVRQTSNFTCWAAALESWAAVCRPAAAMRQEDLIASHPEWQHAGGALKLDGLHALARAFHMTSEIVTGRELTPEYFAFRLGAGLLYLVYRPTPGPVDGHIVVAYACGPAGVDLMDPVEGYITRPWEFLASRVWAFAGWPSFIR